MLDYLILGLSMPIWLATIFLISMVHLLIFRGKLFFFHRRPGLDCKPFFVIKFRTLEEGKRSLSKWHTFLRNSGLDEIPQLFNVLTGEMSLVGPRPLLMEYLDHYNEEQITRHKVKPGITGLSQVNAKKLQSWEEIFELDLEYVNKVSLILDLKVLFKTPIEKWSYRFDAKLSLKWKEGSVGTKLINP